MSGPGAEAAADRAPRLLGLRALPARLRPVTLTVLAHQLRDWQRLGRSLALARQVDPDPLWTYADLAETGWDEVLHDLFNQAVIHDWFPLDAHRLEAAWWGYREDPELNGVELEAYLDYVPLAVQGPAEADLAAHPALRLLRGLLDETLPEAERQRLFKSLPAPLPKLTAGWRPAHLPTAWARLERVEAEPDLFPPAALTLAGLARWVCARSGNLILDGRPTAWLEPDYRYRWEQLPQIRADWQTARPLLAAWEAVRAWSETDNKNLVKLARVVMKGTDYEQLDW